MKYEAYSMAVLRLVFCSVFVIHSEEPILWADDENIVDQIQLLC